jgi:excinuclease ABC subunit A
MRVVAASDWVIDMGPGAGEDGGRVVASGTPDELSVSAGSRTALYLRRFVGRDGSPSSHRPDGASAERDSTVESYQ